ncbi:cytosolic sulfotransferase 13-like [Beta vulgaris subsp. vulgaris]|uniref:cytosolic sulfotransferase 13-like n=1 Tax=Beta vulgaris subsp. vulgaris TaxID=3555 RepID=UPI0025480855|nr:cytosolic sulfotransferase 13-like [Beta vulgaris subsp. vulgaris]
MAASKSQDEDRMENELQQPAELISLLKQTWFGIPIQFHQSFWCSSLLLKGVISFQTHFQAHDNDIILTSVPKTGTTWLKSLLFTIVNRKKLSNDISQHPFHTKNPHELVLHLEFQYNQNTKNNLENLQPNVRSMNYIDGFSETESNHLTEVSLPRIFASHLPYISLPKSIQTSKSRIVYICRNPLDTFVSLWHFFLEFETSKDNTKPNIEMMEEHLDKYCKGIFPFGPYDDHVIGYWKKSVENPEKVLFLEYEGLKNDPKYHLKKLAKFVGYPFSEEEEKGNIIDEIIEVCSLKSLKEMEVNKSGKLDPLVKNKALFRKGEVGDWINYLTPLMAKRFDEMQQNVSKAGFSSTYYQPNL